MDAGLEVWHMRARRTRRRPRRDAGVNDLGDVEGTDDDLEVWWVRARGTRPRRDADQNDLGDVDARADDHEMW